MAVHIGFEPMVPRVRHASLAGKYLKPDSVNTLFCMEDRYGIEPSCLTMSTVFKTAYAHA